MVNKRIRKTVDVSHVRETANKMLKNSTDACYESRLGVRVLTEQILMDTGNYRGFQYLTKKQMKDSFGGTTYGINDDLTFEGTDDSRIQFL